MVQVFHSFELKVVFFFLSFFPPNFFFASSAFQLYVSGALRLSIVREVPSLKTLLMRRGDEDINLCRGPWAIQAFVGIGISKIYSVDKISSGVDHFVVAQQKAKCVFHGG